LDRIWSGYLKLFEKVIKDINLDLETLKKTSLGENSRLHTLY